MKRDSAQDVAEYMALVEKGDQAALIDLMARHPDELGLLSLPAARPTPQPRSQGRRSNILPAVVLFTTAFIILLFAGAALLPLPNQRTAPTATLTTADGNVEMLAAGTSGAVTWQQAQPGALIRAGDRVRTGPNTIAQVTFPDGSVTRLNEDTELIVMRLDYQEDGGLQVGLQQRLGQTYNRIQPAPDLAQHFEIETPAAVTAVRGTEFIVDVKASGATYVAVFVGVVDVTAQKVTVDVQANHETTVEPAQTPAAARLSSMSYPSYALTPTPSAVLQATALGQTETSQPEDEPKLTHTPKPTHTPKATHTVKPSNTPKPTNTSKPTNTPKPANTPKPTKESQPDKEPQPTKTPKP